MIRARSKLTPTADGAKGQHGVETGEAGEPTRAHPGGEHVVSVAGHDHPVRLLGDEPGQGIAPGRHHAVSYERRLAHGGAQLAQVGEGGIGAQRGGHGRPTQYAPMPLPRLAWLITVGIALIVALVLFLDGYSGYAGVSLAVAASAAINLF